MSGDMYRIPPRFAFFQTNRIRESGTVIQLNIKAIKKDNHCGGRWLLEGVRREDTVSHWRRKRKGEMRAHSDGRYGTEVICCCVLALPRR